MTRTLGEVLVLVRDADTKSKVDVLQKYQSSGLCWLLQLAFSGTKWALPEGLPPFTPDPGPIGLTASHLLRELRRLYIFLDGGAPQLAQLRREIMFRDLLQTLDKNEIALLTSVKDKTFSKEYKLSKAQVEKAFPGLLAAPFNVRFIR